MSIFFHQHDPDPTPSGDAGADAAAAAAAAAGAGAPPPAAPEATDAGFLDGFDKAIADPSAPLPDVPAAKAPEPEPRKAKEPKEKAPPADEVNPLDVVTDPATVPGTPEHAAAEKAKADAAAAEAAKGTDKTDEQKAEEARKAEVDAEATRLQLKAEARQKFHEAADYKKATAPIMGLLEKVGVKDVATLEQLVGNAQAAVDIVGMVKETGADGTQYVMALDYLKNANLALNSGDMKAAQQCYDWMVEELKTFAGLLGKEVPGIVDPLAAHADLQADLDAERITRERALEIAASRASATHAAAIRANTDKAAQAQTEQAKAVTDGQAALTALGRELAGTTPESQAIYKRVAPALGEGVKRIAKTLPPSQWVGATRALFETLATLPAPAPTPTPTPAAKDNGNIGPARSAGPGAHLSRADVGSPEEALEAALAAVEARGG